MKKLIRLGVATFFVAASLSVTTAEAAKLSFILGYDFNDLNLYTVEFSGSSGGSYTNTIDLGGTYYYNGNRDGSAINLVSFDLFSALDSVQNYNWLFSAGTRVFLATFSYRNRDNGRRVNDLSFGVSAGLDFGYRFGTGVPTALLLSLDYAPNILIAGRLDQFLQTSLVYEIMFTPIVIGHLSYRNAITAFGESYIPSGLRNLENSLGFGIKLRF